MFKRSQQTSIHAKEKVNIPNGINKIEDLTADEKNAVEEHTTELKIAFISFCISILVVISKLLYINRLRIYKVYSALGAYMSGGKYGSVTKLSEVLQLSSSTLIDVLHESKWLLIPLGAGIGITIITWYTMYIDSCVPGVKPPTPFSPNQRRFRSAARFHTGYIVAIVNGLLVFLLAFFNWS